MSGIEHFPRRIPEPRSLSRVETSAFEELAMRSYRKWFIPLVDDFLDRSRLTRGVVLDVACGPGFLLKELGRRGRDFILIGIDISGAALRLARKNTKKMPGVSFYMRSVTSLPFTDGFFDAVICKDALHHFNDPEKAILEMLRVLRKGGFLYIQDMRRDLPEYLLKRSIPPRSTIQKLQYYSTRAAYTKAEIGAIFKKALGRNVRIRTKYVTRVMRSRYRRAHALSELRESLQARYNVCLRK